MSLDGYSLTERLRKTRRRHNLAAPTQALYYELVAICNEEGWVDEFPCSNNELCLALSISEKSLHGYRNDLIQAGLITYKSGKSKKAIGRYSFNGSKIYHQSEHQSGGESEHQSYYQKGENASDYNKDKPKPKRKLKNEFKNPPTSEAMDPPPNSAPPPPFEEFWNLYAKKRDRDRTEKKWNKLKRDEKESAIRATPAYVRSTPILKYRKHPLTWLNGKCWEDEIENYEQKNTGRTTIFDNP